MVATAAEQVVGAANVAASLEPLAGAALAINLAYLGLTRFRYRDKIRKAADDQRKIFENSEKSAPENIKTMKYYIQLTDLCSLSNFDIDEIPNGKKDAKINSGLWSSIYHYIYRTHRDRWIAYTGACAAGMTVCTGVAVDLGTWALMPWVYSQTTGPLWLYGLIAACLAPIILVWTGRKIVYYAVEHAKECRQEIEKAMQTGAQATNLPSLPQPNGISQAAQS